MTEALPDVVTSAWPRMTLRELLRDGLFVDGDWVESKDQDPSGAVRLTQLADIGDGVWRDRSNRSLSAKKAAQLRCTYLEPGDVLVARMPEPLGRSCVFPGSERPCVTVVDVAILRPSTGSLDPHWLSAAINGVDARSQIAAMQAGSTRQRVSRRNLGTVSVPVPPMDQQRLIARYLGHSDLRVAGAIRAKRELISLLQERKASALTSLLMAFVPQSLGGGAADALPLAPLGSVLREVSELSTTGDEELLSVSHITGVTPRSQKNVTMFMAASYVGYKRVHPGDLAVNTMWAWMGAMGVSSHTGIVSPSYSVYRMRPGSPLLPDYLHHLLRSAKYIDEYNRASTGVTASRARLYPWQLLRLPVCLPSQAEQRRVLIAAETVTASTSAAVDALRREINLLQEYRTRLTSDVVSGRKDIRAQAARMPDVDPVQLAAAVKDAAADTVAEEGDDDAD